MVLQSSGAISLNDIQNEFGGTNPIGIDEYYSSASGIPSSGTISLDQFYGASAETWEIIMHTDGYKGSGNNIGNSAAFGYTGTSAFRSVTSSSTGAFNRRQIGDGVGLYAGYFYKKNIKQFALISGNAGQSYLQSPSSHSSYHVWDAFSADRDGHTDTGNESIHEMLLRLDAYNINNANWAGNDSVFTGASIRNFTAGTNGYSVSSSSAYPNPPTMNAPPIAGGGAFTHTFTNAGATGPNGPTLSQIQSAYSSTSWASDTSKLNMTTQGYQIWTVPASGTYKFTIRGAQGASGSGSGRGGYSRYVIGQVALTAGEKLIFVVGQEGKRITSYLSNANHSPYGAHQACGGGGGTFVVREGGGSHPDANDVPLLVAGGGGGGGWYVYYGPQHNPTGQDVPSSNYSTTQIGNNHKNNGDGGGVYSSNYTGGGGGGWNSDGETHNLAWDMQNIGYPHYSLGNGEGGRSWANGLRGGDGVRNHNSSGNSQYGNRTSSEGTGGFGGGGGALVEVVCRSGAGGGYSGGEGGSYEETGANGGLEATPQYATHELASGSGGNYINSTYVTSASYGNQETSAKHGSILVEQLSGAVTRPDKFSIWGVNQDSDNDTQVLAAYSGTLGVGNGKADSWRNNNPRETYWSYWGNDWYSNTQQHTISVGRQTDPGISTHATTGHTGPVYLIAYGPPAVFPAFPLTYNGTNYSTGNSFTINGSQAEHVFSITSGAQIRFELYGGAGGRGAWSNNTEYGGPGGRVDVTISFTSAATIYAYVGQGNISSSGHAGSGGGSTDIRTSKASDSSGSVTNSTFVSNFYSGMSSTLAVAGGGGGAHGGSYGGWGHSSGNSPGSGGPNTSDTNSRGTNDGGYTATGASTTSAGQDGGQSTSTQYTSHGTFGGALPPSSVGISRTVWAPQSSGSYSGYGWPNGGTGSSWATGGGGGGYYGGATNWPNGGGGSNFIYTSSWGLGTITTNNNTVAANPVNGILTVTIL